MRLNPSCACAMFLFAALQPACEAAVGPDLGAVLLGEPIWTLQAEDGPPLLVWFEQRGGVIELLRCTGGEARCHVSLEISGDRVQIVGDPSGALQLSGEASVPVLRSAGGTTLFPAWVVPSATARGGH